MTAAELFDLTKTLAGELISECRYPEEALDSLGEFIIKKGRELDGNRYVQISEGIWKAVNATVAESAVICPPCIIGGGTEIRCGAFIRGSVLIGNECVVGNSTEVKCSILFDRVQIPHFNYVGDSILGYGAHLGAGAVTSNVKSDKSDIYVTDGEERRNTGRRKLGSLIGDHVEIGCNAVLCPGTVIGRSSTVYPLSLVRGEVPSDSIYKGHKCITPKYRNN